MTRRGSWTRMIGKVTGMAGGLAILTGGCATAGTHGGERTGERELRGSVVVSGAQARSALAGPLHLLHLDYDTRGAVEPYSVARQPGSAGTDADCAGPALMHLSLHGRRTNPIDADVGSDEVVCLVASSSADARTVSVSWHATPSDHAGQFALAAAFRASR
jgi:hypothetical protein